MLKKVSFPQFTTQLQRALDQATVPLKITLLVVATVTGLALLLALRHFLSLKGRVSGPKPAPETTNPDAEKADQIPKDNSSCFLLPFEIQVRFGLININELPLLPAMPRSSERIKDNKVVQDGIINLINEQTSLECLMRGSDQNGEGFICVCHETAHTQYPGIIIIYSVPTNSGNSKEWYLAQLTPDLLGNKFKFKKIAAWLSKRATQCLESLARILDPTETTLSLQPIQLSCSTSKKENSSLGFPMELVNIIGKEQFDKIPMVYGATTPVKANKPSKNKQMTTSSSAKYGGIICSFQDFKGLVPSEVSMPNCSLGIDSCGDPFMKIDYYGLEEQLCRAIVYCNTETDQKVWYVDMEPFNSKLEFLKSLFPKKLAK